MLVLLLKWFVGLTIIWKYFSFIYWLHFSHMTYARVSNNMHTCITFQLILLYHVGYVFYSSYLCLCHIFILPHKYILNYYNVNSKVNKIRAHDNEINNSKKIKPKKNHPQSINIRNTASFYNKNNRDNGIYNPRERLRSYWGFNRKDKS